MGVNAKTHSQKWGEAQEIMQKMGRKNGKTNRGLEHQENKKHKLN